MCTAPPGPPRPSPSLMPLRCFPWVICVCSETSRRQGCSTVIPVVCLGFHFSRRICCVFHVKLSVIRKKKVPYTPMSRPHPSGKHSQAQRGQKLWGPLPGTGTASGTTHPGGAGLRPSVHDSRRSPLFSLLSFFFFPLPLWFALNRKHLSR